MIANPKRKAFDGYTFFGYNGKNSRVNKNGIDFVVKPIKKSNEKHNIIGRYFRIRFDINNMNYFIKDLGCGYGTFKKIINETKIMDSYLINIGKSYLVCTFGVDEYNIDGNEIVDADKILNVKVFSEYPKDASYFFNPRQFKRIYIGREISCNIIVDDTLLSRIHCTIEYKEGEGWFIFDGKFDEEVQEYFHSTNGTWLYLIEETQIEDGMIFKSNQNVYECHIIKQI